MNAGKPASHVIRFGVFELDTASGELRRHGLKIRLPDQSFQVLQLLLNRPGDVVTREELQRALWTTETFVDFDVGLNSAIRRLREALDDSAENSRFVETLPRRGYRFIASVDLSAVPQTVEPDPVTTTTTPMPSGDRLRWASAGILLVVLVAALSVVFYQLERGNSGRLRAGTAAAPATSTANERRPEGVDRHAYQSYLKGTREVASRRFDRYRVAVAYFEEAIARQPDFADAYVALAQTQIQFLFGGPLSPRETMPKAEAAARKALELDNTLAAGHVALGQILTFFSWKWDEGEKAFQRAAELSGDAHEPSGAANLSLIRAGRFGDALAAAERARRRNPLSFNAQMTVANAYRAAGQHDQALVELRRALAMNQDNGRAHFQFGVTYLAMNRIDDAIREFETAVRLPRQLSSRLEGYLGYAYAVAGRPLDARRILDSFESRRREHYVSSFGIALIHDALGEKEPALAAIERAYQDRAVEFAQMNQYPAFKTIASEPRFQAVMRLIGLPR